MVVDVTECRIEQPLDYCIQKPFYSGRSKHHCMKYEVGVEILTGLFVWFSGAWPGSFNDLTIIRRSGLLDKLRLGERIMADKIYIGERQILTAFKNARGIRQLSINRAVYRRRIIVENSLNRIKTFNFTQQEWRHDLKLHPLAFKAIINILNIDLTFRPVRKNCS